MTMSNTVSAPIYLDTGLAVAQIGDIPSALNILSMVEETLRNDIPRITQLLATNDVPGAKRMLHALKGFMPILCSAALCEHVSRVEALSKDGASAEVGQAFAALQPELEQLLAEISTYLKSGGGPG